MVCLGFISDILSHIFKTKFTFPDSLPTSIFTASNECRLEAIKAFIDDEESVSSSFCITQKSAKLLEKIKERDM